MNKYHIVKITSSGLGDAIKSVLAGALYADLSNRTLIVDWRRSRYSNSDENTFEGLFEIVNLNYSENAPKGLKVAPLRWQDRLGFSMHEIYTEDEWPEWNRLEVIKAYSIDFNKLDYDASVTVSWDFDQTYKMLKHYPNCNTLDELYKYSAKSFLNVHKSIHKRVKSISKHLPKDYLAAHIRDTQEFASNKGMTAREKYYNLIKNHIKSDEESFFLATDNRDVQTNLSRAYPNVQTQEKWLGKAGQALHMDENCPDKLENAKQALVDILMLSKASILICNNLSCFAKCAQYFSIRENQKVVNVSRESFLRRLANKIVFFRLQ